MKISAARLNVVMLLAMAGGAVFCRAVAADSSLRDTSEIISALKSNYVDRDKLNDKLLNEATVKGILDALGHGVALIPLATPSTNVTATAVTQPQPTSSVARAEIIDPNIGYVRLADVQDETAAALDAQLKRFADAKVTGYVLDLRYADGTNFAAAAAVASRFLADGQTLFTLKSSEKGAQVFRAGSEPKTNSAVGTDPTSAPLMLLVNSRTQGAAEALAGALRAQDRGIIIGSGTAGSAAAWQDVKLTDGRTLRVATAKIVLPPLTEGGQPTDLFPGGIAPDVAVKIDAKVEHEVVLAPSTNETLTASLQPRVKKKDLTEAQLVKAFHGQAVDEEDLSPGRDHDGQIRPAPAKTNGDEPAADREREEEGEIQNVKDVVLQRAVDILKGIRALLSWQ
ncbi:MAG TPA: S41 family peptidase [Verrucomicrobiae bacterium]|nr:S41 family peptidase [Verrucomicrobiae bacterium]